MTKENINIQHRFTKEKKMQPFCTSAPTWLYQPRVDTNWKWSVLFLCLPRGTSKGSVSLLLLAPQCRRRPRSCVGLRSCVTNYHECSSVKQHPFIVSQFSAEAGQAPLCSLWRVSKPKSSFIGQLASCLEGLGKNPLPSSFKLLVEFGSMWLQI